MSARVDHLTPFNLRAGPVRALEQMIFSLDLEKPNGPALVDMGGQWKPSTDEDRRKRTRQSRSRRYQAYPGLSTESSFHVAQSGVFNL